MPHISPQRLSKNVLDKLYNLLFSALTTRNVSRKQQCRMLRELLTPTEKIMIGKRIAAVSMLSQGISAYKTGLMLKLSPTTVAKLHVKLERGKLAQTEKICAELRKGPLEKILEHVLNPSLPRYGKSPAQLMKEKLDEI